MIWWRQNPYTIPGYLSMLHRLLIDAFIFVIGKLISQVAGLYHHFFDLWDNFLSDGYDKATVYVKVNFLF